MKFGVSQRWRGCVHKRVFVGACKETWASEFSQNIRTRFRKEDKTEGDILESHEWIWERCEGIGRVVVVWDMNEAKNKLIELWAKRKRYA